MVFKTSHSDLQNYYGVYVVPPPVVPTDKAVASRQEPGRNFGGIEPGPQSHPVTEFDVITGVRIIVVASMLVSPVPCTVTLTEPILLVETSCTYFVAPAPDTSQPQLPAVGNEAALLV